MSGYTKLFSSIIGSTIWRESHETRIVWITMLAIVDKHGEVHHSIPGLADASRVTIEQCKEALKVLSSPDEYSRTKDYEGRRIEEIDGGWIILNHGKYREKMSADERREYNRLKKAEQRERDKRKSKPVNDSQPKSAMSAHTDADAKADTNTKEESLIDCKQLVDDMINKAAEKLCPVTEKSTPEKDEEGNYIF